MGSPLYCVGKMVVDYWRGPLIVLGSVLYFCLNSSLDIIAIWLEFVFVVL